MVNGSVARSRNHMLSNSLRNGGTDQNSLKGFIDIPVHRDEKKTLTWCDNHLSAGPKMQHIPLACLSTVVDSTTKSLPPLQRHVSQIPRRKLQLPDRRGFRLIYHENHGVPYSMETFLHRHFLIQGPRPRPSRRHW